MESSRTTRRNTPGDAPKKRKRQLGEDDFRAVSLRVAEGAIHVVLDDGREASASIAKWFPFLEALSDKQLRRTRLDDNGEAVYFPAIEEWASVFSIVHPERTVLALPLRRPVKPKARR